MTRDGDPYEGDLARVTFERTNGVGDPMVQGAITEVDTDPDAEPNDYFVRIDEANSGNQEIHYYEGRTPDGEIVHTVGRHSPFSGYYKLGDEAHLEVL